MTSILPDTRTPLTVKLDAPIESITLRCPDKVVAPPSDIPSLSNADSLAFPRFSVAVAVTRSSSARAALARVHAARQEFMAALARRRTTQLMIDIDTSWTNKKRAENFENRRWQPN